MKSWLIAYQKKLDFWTSKHAHVTIDRQWAGASFSTGLFPNRSSRSTTPKAYTSLFSVNTPIHLKKLFVERGEMARCKANTMGFQSFAFHRHFFHLFSCGLLPFRASLKNCLVDEPWVSHHLQKNGVITQHSRVLDCKSQNMQ